MLAKRPGYPIMGGMRYAFADCLLDTETHSLTRNGQPQKVEPQVFDLLCLLVENAGNLVTQDALIEHIWQGRIVSDSAISARIAAARKAVGDDGKRQAIIRTIARRGLQFVAEVTAGGQATPAKADNGKLIIRYATASDGVKLAYAVNGAGPPLLRVMHFPTNLELHWNEPVERAFIDAAMQHCMLVRMDERGSGLSDPIIEKWDIDQRASDIGAVADALGLGQFVLMGSSGGSLHAVQFAASYPERISKLIIQSGYVDGRMLRSGGRNAQNSDSLVTMLREGWNERNAAFVMAAISAYMPDVSPAIIRRLAADYQASASTKSALIYREGVNNHSIADQLHRVRAPTLIIHSRDDAVHPLSEARKMAGGIADAELVVLESANHYVFPEDPAWQHYLDALFEFIERP